MSPKVSINLCCYNSEKYLRETLDSIINQTYKDWELVIINDGSTDSTETIIEEYINKGYPIIYHYQENHGLGYSRNEALKRSNGEYIAFIDHDDIWLPDKLETQVLTFEKNMSIDFIYSNYFILNQQTGKKFIYLKGKQPTGYVFQRFLKKYPVGLLSVMVRKASLYRLRFFFDPALMWAEEFDLFMRLLYKARAIYISKPLAIYRYHDNMFSKKYFHKMADEYKIFLCNLKKEYLDININQKKDIMDFYIKNIVYLKAKSNFIEGKFKSAREQLKEYKWYNLKNIILYLATFAPNSIVSILKSYWFKKI